MRGKLADSGDNTVLISTILSWAAMAYLVVGLAAGAVRALTLPDQRAPAFRAMARAVVAFVVLYVAAYIAAAQGI